MFRCQKVSGNKVGQTYIPALYPVTSELIRRAGNGSLVLEESDLGPLWHCDTVPLFEIRRQLLEVLEREYFEPKTKNNLIILCCYNLFWQISSADSLAEMSRLVEQIDNSESSSALNFHSARARAYAESGRPMDALLSIDRAIAVAAEQLELMDAWVLISRLAVVCRRAGKMQDALYFYQQANYVAEIFDRSRPMSQSKWGVAYGLVGTGKDRAAAAVAKPLLDNLLAGHEWIMDANRPMAPLILAKCYLISGDYEKVQKMISLARELQIPGNEQYSDGTLLQIQAELLQRQGAGRAALDPLFDGMEELLELRNLDLYVVKRSLDIYQKLELRGTELRIDILRDINASLSPDSAVWALKILGYRHWIQALPCLAGTRGNLDSGRPLEFAKSLN